VIKGHSGRIIIEARWVASARLSGKTKQRSSRLPRRPCQTTGTRCSWRSYDGVPSDHPIRRPSPASYGNDTKGYSRDDAELAFQSSRWLVPAGHVGQMLFGLPGRPSVIPERLTAPGPFHSEPVEVLAVSKDPLRLDNDEPALLEEGPRRQADIGGEPSDAIGRSILLDLLKKHLRHS
jgi:hypothetical protein